MLAFAGLAPFAGLSDLVFAVAAGFGAVPLAGARGEVGSVGVALCAALDPAEDFETLDCVATGVLETGLA